MSTSKSSVPTGAKPSTKAAMRAGSHRPRLSVRTTKGGEAGPPSVSVVVTRGGYVVYGTPLRPRHLSLEQIESAVASLR